MNATLEARMPGLVLTALGVVFFVGGAGYGVVDSGRMGPGLMPALSGAALTVLGLVITWHGVATTERQIDHPLPADGEQAEAADTLGSRAARPWIIFGIVLAVLVATHFLGLLIALTAMVFGILLVVERLAIWIAVVASLGTLIVSWSIFVSLLGVPMPVGVLLGG